MCVGCGSFFIMFWHTKIIAVLFFLAQIITLLNAESGKLFKVLTFFRIDFKEKKLYGFYFYK